VTKDRRAGLCMAPVCGLRLLLPDGLFGGGKLQTRVSDFEKLLSAGRRAGGGARARGDRGRLWRLWSGRRPGGLGGKGEGLRRRRGVNEGQGSQRMEARYFEYPACGGGL
jgi:hypothetical protein